MKNNDNKLVNKIIMSYAMWPSMLLVITVSPCLLGLVLTHQRAWLDMAVQWAVFSLSAFFIMWVLAVASIYTLISLNHFRSAATLFVMVSPWTWTETWNEAMELVDVDTNSFEEEMEIRALKESTPVDVIEKLFYYIGI